MIKAATEKESRLGMSRFLSYGMIAVLLFTVLLAFPVENAMGDLCSENHSCYLRQRALLAKFLQKYGLTEKDLQ